MKKTKIVDAYRNAVGTVFLLAGAFFICSTLLSMRTVLADPIAPNPTAQSRLSPARTSGRTVAGARSSASRSTVLRAAPSRSATTRPAATGNTSGRSLVNRAVVSRGTNSGVAQPQAGTAKRTVVSRGGNKAGVSNAIVTSRTGNSRDSKRVVARAATNQSRVSLVGSGMRASTSGVTVSNLTSRLYTGNYSNIIDSQTGLISADAYSTCLDSYYTCMDEICTARSDTKGRCSCAGRVTNFLDAETALEKSNEELIELSGQLALLVATKGKGDDLSYAFSLTDAEKVMNCVSYRENVQLGAMTEEDWYADHPTWDNNTKQTSGVPYYCKNNNITGFDMSAINGSSSDILASLKAWADAKDNAQSYIKSDDDALAQAVTGVSNIVNGLGGVNIITEDNPVRIDDLANTWGYKLFQYAHNNVCGRVLDSCFNGIYEACGTPPTVKVNSSTGGTTTATMCANNATSNCPFNYNSKVEIDTKGEVALNERGSGNATTSSSASCFGYTTTSTTTTDPYASLRGPVADARRGIMQKYLLDANAACDTYGAALKTAAQNINYQKIAAEQALRQKRLEFYTTEQAAKKDEAVLAVDNFNECISEIWDCYNENSDEDNWSTARIKTYCAQVAQVPHCYETMICNPIQVTTEVVDLADTSSCSVNIKDDNTGTSKNTCRNVVTLNEILYGAAQGLTADSEAFDALLSGNVSNKDSRTIREACIQKALNCGPGTTDDECLRKWKKPSAEKPSESDE